MHPAILSVFSNKVVAQDAPLHHAISVGRMCTDEYTDLVGAVH